MAQSPELEAWWQSHGGRTATVIEKLRAASEYLGDEIAVVGLPNGDGPVFLSEIKRPGFAEFLKQVGFGPGSMPAEQERNGLVLFGAPGSVEQLSGVLDSPNGAIQGTDFYGRVEDAYQHGAGFLVCANLTQVSHPVGGLERSVRPMPNAQALIFNETQVKARWRLAFRSISKVRARESRPGWPARRRWARSITFLTDAAAAAAAVVPNGGGHRRTVEGDCTARIRRGARSARQQSGRRICHCSRWNADACALMETGGGSVPSACRTRPRCKKQWRKYTNGAQERRTSGRLPQLAGDTSKAGLTTAIAVPGGGPLLEFHYTFADGYMIAGPTRGVVTRALQIKSSGNSLMHSSKFTALMPRDHYTNFSLVFYQNLAPSIAPIAGLLGGLLGGMAPHQPGQHNTPDMQIGALSSLKPSLIAAYAEPDRITFAANGDLLGPALANLMRGDLAGAAGSALPFFQPRGTRKREMAYR